MTIKDLSTELTPRQRKGIAALLATRTEAEAARMVGVLPRTFSRWMEQPAFRAELKRVLQETTSKVVGETLKRLTDGQKQALDVLEGVMETGKANERRQAAATWLITWRDMTELVDFSERLDRLEKDMKP